MKKFIIALLASALCWATACNKESEDDNSANEPTTSSVEGESSTLVTAFSLRPYVKLLQNLDSVFFSIDQVKAQIFNADSLPWGTDVRKIPVLISAPSTATGVDIIMPNRTDGTDTVINYLSNPTDSVNFSHGSVWLRITPASGEQRIYTVKLNVHAINPDSLQWEAERQSLPGPDGQRRQKAAQLANAVYSLSSNGRALTMAHTANPLSGQWTSAAVSGLPSDVRIETLTATSNSLYILGADGALYSSADGSAWSATGSTGWRWLYGAMEQQLVGSKGTKWATWPAGTEGDIPAAMPVEGTSQLWSYTDQWFITPQCIMAGGQCADGSLSNAAWGFDGSAWIALSGVSRNLPSARDMTLFPYFCYLTTAKNYFSATRQSAWIALGGTKADGSLQKDVYLSTDNGINWRRAPQAMQLPAAMAPRSGASVAIAWEEFSANSRAVRPITEWNAPIIFLFGGYDASGTLCNEMWRGAINRLTFKPIQ